MNIYIMPHKKFVLNEKKVVFIKDIADVYSPKGQDEIKNTIILKIPDVKRGVYSISSLEIVEKILNKFPYATIINQGENEVLIEYSQKQPKENRILTLAKVLFVSAVLFAGGATAIMSFHSDAEIPDIIESYYDVFDGESQKDHKLLEISYAIGLFFGITIFFNHFLGKNMTYDPTPIEVQMTSYEDQVIRDQLQQVKKDEVKK